MDFIFLTGHRKSGTTLLHKLFDGHPELNVFPVDISLLYAYLPCHISHLELEEAQERVNIVIRESTNFFQGMTISENCKAYNVDDFLLCLWELSSVDNFTKPANVIEAFANAWCTYAGLDTRLPFVLKETSQSIHAQKMVNDGLSVRFIHLVRDPRDNYAAIKAGVAQYYSQMGENDKEALASVINRSRMDLIIGSDILKSHSEWFTAIRFEDLTQSPDTSMKLLADFCEISFLPILTQPTVLGDNFSGNSYDGEIFSCISNKNVGRWKERISDFETGVIEFWMSDVMELWGYKRCLTMEDASNAYAEFYNWYNCRYFYYDSFGINK